MYFLEASKGDLQTALDAFYDRGNEPSQSSSTQPPKQEKSKIKTFQELMAGNQDEDDEENRTYAGGEKSGIALKGPKKDTNLAKDILEQAKKQGSEPAPEHKSQKSSFVGSGIYFPIRSSSRK